jgi:hypothetical protein
MIVIQQKQNNYFASILEYKIFANCSRYKHTIIGPIEMTLHIHVVQQWKKFQQQTLFSNSIDVHPINVNGGTFGHIN